MRPAKHVPGHGRPATPPGAVRGLQGSAALSLQRVVGNRAVGQVLARKPAPAKRAAPQSGLRREAAMKRYATKGVKFLRRNGDLPLHHFAIFLGAAVNTELDELGIPSIKVTTGRGSMSALAEFDAENWQMTLNPDEFTHRDGVEKIGDLNADEAAIVAMTVYHEARHAEQHFRIARLQAAEGDELGFAMGDDAAAAAAAAPLSGKGTSALELKEAKSWRTNEIGDDATYREAVTSWMGDIRKAARLARDVTSDDANNVRERIGSLMRGWSKQGGAEEYIRSHLASAKARKARVIQEDIGRISGAFDRAQAAWKKLDDTSSPADFKPLAQALADLARAVNTAYRDQPVEHDAWAAGDAIFEIFQKQLAAAGPPAP